MELTFLLAPGHARPVGLLAYGQVKVRTGVGQHGQWEFLDDRVRVATLSGTDTSRKTKRREKGK